MELPDCESPSKDRIREDSAWDRPFHGFLLLNPASELLDRHLVAHRLETHFAPHAVDGFVGIDSRFESDLGSEPITYEIDPSETPPHLDLIHTHDGKSFRAMGIYRLDGDLLTIVVHEPPESVRPTQFHKDTPPKAQGKHSGRLFVTLKRNPAGS